MVVYAEANHGRWIVNCPNCNSADLLRVWARFTCQECHRIYNIIVPENKNEIDKVLNLRPNATNRNWTPGETIEMLHLENVLHGVEEI